MFPGVNEIMKRGTERGGDPPFIVFQGASPQEHSGPLAVLDVPAATIFCLWTPRTAAWPNSATRMATSAGSP